MKKALLSLAVLLMVAAVADAGGYCPQNVRLVERVVVRDVAPAANVTQLSVGPFGRLRSFQQINGGGGAALRTGGGSATQLRVGPLGKLRSFQQVN